MWKVKLTIYSYSAALATLAVTAIDISFLLILIAEPYKG